MADLPIGVPGQGIQGLDPEPGELAGISNIDEALAWPGITSELAAGLWAVLGQALVLRDIAFLCRDDWARYVAAVQVTTAPNESRPALPMELSRLWSFRRICRIRCGLAPGDSMATQVATTGITQINSGVHGANPISTITGGAIKLDQILDPSLSAVLVSMDPASVTRAYDGYIAKFGANPEESVDPSPDQLSALNQVLQAGRIPYAHFGYFGPHGKRLLEKLVLLAFVLLPTGYWQKQELDGPPSFDSWWNCWRVYRAAMLLLDAADSETLDNYAELVRSLALRYGRECWFIVYTADQRCRSERWDRLRRDAERTFSALPAAEQATSQYSPARPWNHVLTMCRNDTDWWYDNCKEPAMLYLNHSRSADQVLDDGTGHPELGHGRQAAEPPRNSPKPANAERLQPGIVSDKGADSSQKDQNGRFTHNRKGKKICAPFSDGGCDKKGSACDAGVHQCCWCLSTHPGSDCNIKHSQDSGSSKRGRGGVKGGGKNTPRKKERHKY
jgi:hypothetical protein